LYDELICFTVTIVFLIFSIAYGFMIIVSSYEVILHALLICYLLRYCLGLCLSFFFKFIIVYICMYSSDRYIIDIWKYNLDLNKL